MNRPWLLALLVAGSLLQHGESCNGSGAACTDPSYPLQCPVAGGCCPAGSPYSCTSAATGKSVCLDHAFPAGYCADAQDYCSVDGKASANDGYVQCASSPLDIPLYCDTLVGPQLLDGVPGECCSVGVGATRQIGYLCVFGNTTSSGGVCQDMPTISAGCPKTGTVVRCCAGGPC